MLITYLSVSFNGWGVSVYDALDTLWLMDMKPEFERAVDHVSQTPFHTHPVRVESASSIYHTLTLEIEIPGHVF